MSVTAKLNSVKSKIRTLLKNRGVFMTKCSDIGYLCDLIKKSEEKSEERPRIRANFQPI